MNQQEQVPPPTKQGHIGIRMMDKLTGKTQEERKAERKARNEAFKAEEKMLQEQFVARRRRELGLDRPRDPNESSFKYHGGKFLGALSGSLAADDPALLRSSAPGYGPGGKQTAGNVGIGG